MKPELSTAALAAGYRADIDGLRAVVVLAVVVFHAWPAVLVRAWKAHIRP